MKPSPSWSALEEFSTSCLVPRNRNSLLHVGRFRAFPVTTGFTVSVGLAPHRQSASAVIQHFANIHARSPLGSDFRHRQRPCVALARSPISVRQFPSGSLSYVQKRCGARDAPGSGAARRRTEKFAVGRTASPARCTRDVRRKNTRRSSYCIEPRKSRGVNLWPKEAVGAPTRATSSAGVGG